MKKIYNILLATFALFAFAPVINALDDDPPYTDEGGLCYSKTISEPNTDGVYTITLESFVTGSVTITNESVPADIVLVLDVSGSMDEPIYYTARQSQAYSYNSYGENTTYYFLYNGNYYPVERNTGGGGLFQPTYYRLRFNTGNNWRYLNGNGSQGSAPNNVTSATNTIYTGVLYEAGPTKMDELKVAVNSFIRTIQNNDLYDKDGNRRVDSETNQPKSLGNRISIVKFGVPSYYNSATTATTAVGNHFVTGSVNNNQWTFSNYTTNYTGADNQYNISEVIAGFTNTSTSTATVMEPTDQAKAADVQGLTNVVNGLIAKGATASDYGMNLARLLINSLNSDESRKGSARTVVFFTDGSPTHASSFNDNVATAAISRSREIKQSGADDAHPQVFSIGVFDNTPTSGDNIDRFMNYVSSNYPEASGINETQSGPKDSDIFYLDASSGEVDLEDVFQTVAHAAGGSDKDLTNATVSNVDIVSASFMLPPGTDPSKIKLYTAPYLGTKDAAGYLQFGPKIAKGSNTATYRERVKDADGTVHFQGDPKLVDGGLKAELAASVAGGKNDKIIVTGFDYANNFCGEDDLQPNPGYNGHKVIIEIPIMMDTNAVGGPDVATNAPGSGIYVNGENIIKFKSPEVSLPVNIHIRKEGLREGESAKFTIQRKYVKDSDAPGGSNPWVDVTSVFVTRHEGQDEDGKDAPITKIMGMPSVDKNDKPFVYQIVEDNWSWSYTSTAATPTTSDLLVTNPFIFTNTKIEGIDYRVRHAESKATNTFKTGVTTVQYDDSKKNTGTGRTN